MDHALKGGKPENLRCDCLILPVGPERSLGTTAKRLDELAGGQIERALSRGDLGQGGGRTLLLAEPQGLRTPRLLLVQSGKRSLDAAGFRKLVRSAAAALVATGARDGVLCLDDVSVTDRDPSWCAGEAVMAAREETYRFHDYLSEPGENLKVELARFDVHHGSAPRASLNRAIKEAAAIADGVAKARTLGNLPGNVCHPSYLAAEARKLGQGEKRMTVRVLEEKQLQNLGMGAFLSVTAGTEQPAKLIVMEYRGGAQKAKPLVLVGKGITFDTGGISIKPGAGMDEMKFDMCGAASVFGTMQAVLAMALPLNVIGLVAAAENMPSGSASRPGDIVRTMSGQTVEILNTDAEGRMVLCDTLTYAERYKPQAVVDVATLTGACVIALGNHASGLFSNDDTLASELLQAGEDSGDRAWRMPLWEDYQQQLRSNFADMANVGGREAGSVTAACFLSRFTRSYRWAHLDVAGSAWLSGAKKGATGRPVRLLVEWLRSHVN
ncbi:MAG: leucyl aminopeptidase [Gammaproteobacteria bacterium]|nr:leucyl aminopeptidase [Gammaproteobacteria bacterium]